MIRMSFEARDEIQYTPMQLPRCQPTHTNPTAKKQEQQPHNEHKK